MRRSGLIVAAVAMGVLAVTTIVGVVLLAVPGRFTPAYDAWGQWYDAIVPVVAVITLSALVIPRKRWTRGT